MPLTVLLHSRFELNRDAVPRGVVLSCLWIWRLMEYRIVATGDLSAASRTQMMPRHVDFQTKEFNR